MKDSVQQTLIKVEEKTNADNLYDRIRKYYLDPEKFPLAEKELQIHDRWVFVFNQMLARFTEADIVVMLKARGLTPVQARNEILQVKLLFGDVIENNKALQRHLLLQSCQELERVARAKMDLKMWGLAIKLQSEISGFKHEDIDKSIYEKIQKHDITINLDDQSKLLLAKILESGVVNLTDIPIEEAEIVPEETNGSTDDTV